MTFCTSCGTQISSDSRYCGKCGAPAFIPMQEAPRNNSPQMIQPSSPAPREEFVRATNMTGENTLGMIPLRQLKSLGRYDPFVGVITNNRLIFARLTSDMIKDSVTRARNEAKSHGKGYLGQISSQMREYSSGYTNRYANMQPSSILSETPGNFALGNESITELRLKLRESRQGNGNDNEFELEIFSGGARYEFRMDENGEYIDLLKGVYGQRVRTPFGYSSRTLKLRI